MGKRLRGVIFSTKHEVNICCSCYCCFKKDEKSLEVKSGNWDIASPADETSITLNLQLQGSNGGSFRTKALRSHLQRGVSP